MVSAAPISQSLSVKQIWFQLKQINNTDDKMDHETDVVWHARMQVLDNQGDASISANTHDHLTSTDYNQDQSVGSDHQETRQDPVWGLGETYDLGFPFR